MSLPLDLLDHFDEVVEQVIRVMRPGGSLGMVLHAEHGLYLVAKPFNGAVVEVLVGYLDIGSQRVRIDGDLRFVHTMASVIAA